MKVRNLLKFAMTGASLVGGVDKCIIAIYGEIWLCSKLPLATKLKLEFSFGDGCQQTLETDGVQ